MKKKGFVGFLSSSISRTCSKSQILNLIAVHFYVYLWNLKKNK